MMKMIIKMATMIAASVFMFTTSSCMVRTVTGEGGQVLYQKPVHGSPWESQSRRMQEVEATERSLGIHNE